MKIQTSDTFDNEKIFRVRLEIEGAGRNLFDREVIYKDNAHPGALDIILNDYQERLNYLLENKFQVFVRLTSFSLPHGQQVIETEYNNDTEFTSIRMLFKMHTALLIGR